ncbi:MAG TPA: hypothetical protein VJY84_03035 [Candidatus Saccharimonadales bacterium]|nr:hypothetical protein [Candidatus Saccharimonadales bacterium]
MSKPFEGGSDQVRYDNIDRKIWRNYRIAMGLAAAAFTLGASLLIAYKAAAGDNRPEVAHIQPSAPDLPQQLAELYRQSP